jgi:Transposase DDE domain
MHVKKHLSFGGLRKMLSTHFSTLAEYRQYAKIKYRLHDVCMSGVAVMFFQDPSLLQFQMRMQEELQRNNLQTLFQVEHIPQDTQMREVIDSIESDSVSTLFLDFFRALQRAKYLQQYLFLDGWYLISLDGSEYFSSEKLCCPGCLRKEDKKGRIRYHHEILQAALMHPTMRQVIPLAPEAIKNTDGTTKQDCEINAAKRLVKRIRRDHPKLRIIIVADSLHSKQPFIEELHRLGMRYILVVKEQDHKILMEWVNEQRQLQEVCRLRVEDRKGRHHVYEWINGVPLNGNQETVWVNYCEYWLYDEEGKNTYHNSWVTGIPIGEDNVREIVRGGRCRWKIENEVFNTLKNQGYHIEHNYGHGKRNLSMNFFLFNLLAFFMHQIFELSDGLYQQCRKAFGSKRNLWDHLRAAIRLLVFPDWQVLLMRVLRPSEFL